LKVTSTNSLCDGYTRIALYRARKCAYLWHMPNGEDEQGIWEIETGYIVIKVVN